MLCFREAAIFSIRSYASRRGPSPFFGVLASHRAQRLWGLDTLLLCWDIIQVHFVRVNMALDGSPSQVVVLLNDGKCGCLG